MDHDGEIEKACGGTALALDRGINDIATLPDLLCDGFEIVSVGLDLSLCSVTNLLVSRVMIEHHGTVSAYPRR